MSYMDVWKQESINGRDNAISRLKLAAKPIKVYGSGRFALFTAEILVKNGLQLAGFIDEEKYYKPGKTIVYGGVEYPCERISSIDVNECGFNIVMGIQDYRKYKYFSGLMKDGVQVEWIDNVDFHIMNDGFLEKNETELVEIRDTLCDDESKCVLDAFLNARFNGDCERLVDLVHDEKYFYDWDLIGINKEDVVIDAGAFIGDTVTELLSYAGGQIKKIFAFEPDKENYRKLKRFIADSEIMCVDPINAGLYSVDDMLRFSSSGTIGSSVNSDGDAEIIVQAIDNHKEYENVSVIKMDIEGSEVEALKGALKTIRNNKPRLAICIYHNNDDIIKIYNILKPVGYDFYLRQHGYNAEETVLYAV